MSTVRKYDPMGKVIMARVKPRSLAITDLLLLLAIGSVPPQRVEVDGATATYPGTAGEIFEAGSF